MSTAADSQLGPAAGRSSRRITSWSTSSSSASFRALPSGVSCPSPGLLETRRARGRDGLLEGEVDAERAVLPELHQVREGVGLRASDEDLVGPGNEVEARRRVPEREPVHVDGRPRRLRLHRQPDLSRPRQLGAELVEPLPEGGRERVRAHDVPWIDPEHGAKGVVRGVATSLRAQRHPPDQLGIAEGLRPVRSGWEPLELRQGLVEEGERVGDAVVVEEVLGGRHLSAHLVERVRGRRAHARLELLVGQELRSDPVRQPLLELSRVAEQVRIPAVTQGDQRHPGCGHRTRGGEHHREHPAANRNHVNPPLLRHLQALACSSQKASNESADPRRAMV